MDKSRLSGYSAIRVPTLRLDIGAIFNKVYMLTKQDIQDLIHVKSVKDFAETYKDRWFKSYEFSSGIADGRRLLIGYNLNAAELILASKSSSDKKKHDDVYLITDLPEKWNDIVRIPLQSLVEETPEPDDIVYTTGKLEEVPVVKNITVGYGANKPAPIIIPRLTDFISWEQYLGLSKEDLINQLEESSDK